MQKNVSNSDVKKCTELWRQHLHDHQHGEWGSMCLASYCHQFHFPFCKVEAQLHFISMPIQRYWWSSSEIENEKIYLALHLHDPPLRQMCLQGPLVTLLCVWKLNLVKILIVTSKPPLWTWFPLLLLKARPTFPLESLPLMFALEALPSMVLKPVTGSLGSEASLLICDWTKLDLSDSFFFCWSVYIVSSFGFFLAFEIRLRMKEVMEMMATNMWDF